LRVIDLGYVHICKLGTVEPISIRGHVYINVINGQASASAYLGLAISR